MKTLQAEIFNCLIIMIMASIPLNICKAQGKQLDNTPVTQFHLDRFLGKWYEIARFDHKFERGLHYVTAQYSMRVDGKVKVLNTGYKNGKKNIAEGKAKIVHPGQNEGYLRVAFFLFFYADYRILLLDDNYQYALIGSKKDNYLWIMSRTPEIDNDTRCILIQEARRRGYDTSRLIWVKQ